MRFKLSLSAQESHENTIPRKGRSSEKQLFHPNVISAIFTAHIFQVYITCLVSLWLLRLRDLLSCS